MNPEHACQVLALAVDGWQVKCRAAESEAAALREEVERLRSRIEDVEARNDGLCTILNECESTLGEARAEVERLREERGVILARGWRVASALQSSITEARALLVLWEDRAFDDGHPLSLIDETRAWLAANPEVKP